MAKKCRNVRTVTCFERPFAATAGRQAHSTRFDWFIKDHAMQRGTSLAAPDANSWAGSRAILRPPFAMADIDQQVIDWMGVRPSISDSLPTIGPTRDARAFCSPPAMAIWAKRRPMTAAIISDLVAGRTPRLSCALHVACDKAT